MDIVAPPKMTVHAATYRANPRTRWASIYQLRRKTSSLQDEDERRSVACFGMLLHNGEHSFSFAMLELQF
jgi:hypothetical protein